MADNYFYAGAHTSEKVNPVRGAFALEFDANGLVLVDSAIAVEVDAVEDQGAVRVDFTGTQEALTAGTAQTADTCSAIYMRNSTGASVINIREDTVSGAILATFAIAANASRVVVFPTPLTATTAIYVQAVSGGLHGTPGILIP